MTSWRDLATAADNSVDLQWGEAVRLMPFHKTQYMTEWVADGSRQEVAAVATVIGRGTMLRSAGNASFISRRAEADLLLSIQDKYWVGTIREHDRVALTERTGHVRCEISYIEPGTNGRSVFHLLREKVQP